MNNLQLSNHLILTKLAAEPRGKRLAMQQQGRGRPIPSNEPSFSEKARLFGESLKEQIPNAENPAIKALSGANAMTAAAQAKSNELDKQIRTTDRVKANITKNIEAAARADLMGARKLQDLESAPGNLLARIGATSAANDGERAGRERLMGARTAQNIEGAPGSLIARIGARSAAQDAGEATGRANLMGARTAQNMDMANAPGNFTKQIGARSAANTKAYAANQAEHGGDFLSAAVGRQQAQNARLAEETQRGIEGAPSRFNQQIGATSAANDVAAREAARNKAAQDNNQTVNQQLAGEEAAAPGYDKAAEVARWKALPVSAKIQEVATNMGKPLDQYTGGYGSEVAGGTAGALGGVGLARAMGAKGLGTTVGGLAGAGLGAGVAHGLKTGKLQELIAKLTAGNKPTA